MCFTTLRLVIATVGTRCIVPIYLRHSQGMMLYLISPPEGNRKHPGMKNKTREHISNLTVLTRNITAIRMCWRMFIHLSGRHRKKHDVWIGPRIQQILPENHYEWTWGSRFLVNFIAMPYEVISFDNIIINFFRWVVCIRSELFSCITVPTIWKSALILLSFQTFPFDG